MQEENSRVSPSPAHDRPSYRYSLTSMLLASMLIACIAVAVSGVVGLVNASWMVLKTTPFMGVMVDANGDPLPVQGYPQLRLGMARTLVSTLLAVFIGSRLFREKVDVD